MISRHIEIDLWGETKDDVELAFEEAVERLAAGCVSGLDRNETGGFIFTNVPSEEN